ncbi:signal recognition particle-docking protein FtsY [Candidatus Binatia bacterium]|nr:signal recognition particle-docking protein FtsY [Candidatus Binatia bacterium]
MRARQGATGAAPEEIEETRPARPAASQPGVVSYRDRLRGGLAKSRAVFAERLTAAFGRGSARDADLEALEEVLIEGDVGVRATQDLLAGLRGLPAEQRNAAGMTRALRSRMRALLADVPPETASLPKTPWVVLVVGVNGVGKTTTIGKLAARHRAAGRSVLLVAGDTFRAAAIEQLGVWAERADCQIVKQGPGSDPSSVVFDGMSAAVARGVDVVLIDTAGRLHTKVNLMEELKKVRRVVDRVLPGAPHEVLLVVDATTGQNAVSQARTFAGAVDVTGVILTKLDGSARGGVVVAISHELGLPVRYVGVGESVADLQPFDPDAYVDALLAAE